MTGIKQLRCPNCDEVMESLNYAKSFYFDEQGKRYDGVWTWVFDCCGAEWLDSQLQFDLDMEPGEKGWVSASLTDSVTGQRVLSWLDYVP